MQHRPCDTDVISLIDGIAINADRDARFRLPTSPRKSHDCNGSDRIAVVGQAARLNFNFSHSQFSIGRRKIDGEAAGRVPQGCGRSVFRLGAAACAILGSTAMFCLLATPVRSAA